jgi:PAS domain S-box-containing protein
LFYLCDRKFRTFRQVKANELTDDDSTLSRANSEALYHKMLDEIVDYSIIFLDPQGYIAKWNKGAEKIKGYTASEIIGKNFEIFYPESDRASGLPAQLLKVATEQGSVNHEGWRVRKDVTKFWGSVVMTAIHNSKRQLIGFSKVTRDLTEQKRADDNIRRYAEELQSANEQLAAVNEEIAATNEELAAANEELAAANEELSAANEELATTNEELRQSEERYHMMIAEVQDYAIILLDRDGNIEDWNAGAEFIKGYTAQEIIGKNFRIFYTNEDRERNLPEILIDLAIRKGRAHHEGWRVRKDKTKFWGSITITALHGANGEIIGFSKVTRDLTEKKIAEDILTEKNAQLEEANRELKVMNKELSSFAYISSHDLQEPLRKIQTFSTRILETDKLTLTQKGLDYFHRITNAAARMRALIDDLLAYSRANTAERRYETTDLNNLLKEVLADLDTSIEEKKAVIESTPLPTLNVIQFQFQQLLFNLLTNALKFSKNGISPYILIRHKLIPAEKVPGLQKKISDNYHCISVADNGIGFSPEHNERIFEVFQRLHGRDEYVGTGIGLAICKKIAENHLGIIHAEGRPDEGATFSVYIPAAL